MSYEPLMVPTSAESLPTWLYDELQRIGAEFSELESQIDMLVPAGSLCYLASATIPKGYLAANGQTVELKLYPRLAPFVGLWGAAAAGFIKLPDAQGKVPAATKAGWALGATVAALTSGATQNVQVWTAAVKY